MEKWKLIEQIDNNSVELYDLESNLGEYNNLAEKMPELSGRLQRNLAEWRQRTNANISTQKVVT